MIFPASEAGSAFKDVCGLVLNISWMNLGQGWIAVGILVQRKKTFVEQELSGGSTGRGVEQWEPALVILGWLFWGESCVIPVLEQWLCSQGAIPPFEDSSPPDAQFGPLLQGSWSLFQAWIHGFAASEPTLMHQGFFSLKPGMFAITLSVNTCFQSCGKKALAPNEIYSPKPEINGTWQQELFFLQRGCKYSSSDLILCAPHQARALPSDSLLRLLFHPNSSPVQSLGWL